MVKFKLIILVLLTTLQSFGYAQMLLKKTTVWAHKEDNMFAHFVYGLTVTEKGTILALAEARIDNASDDGAHHIVIKRSTDNGLSFSDSERVVESDKAQSWTNPTILQDRETEEIFLFYALNLENSKSQVFYKTSLDDGISWSEPVNITSLFKENKHGWSFHLPGPGHGIQLRAGRLLVPVWHRRPISFSASERNYGVNCIYSDDHGKTWKIGNNAPVGEFNESQVVEKANGDILLIGRTHSSAGGSFQARVLSKNQGIDWSAEIEYDKGLTGKACDIGLIRYSFKPNILLVSQPADAKKRRDLTIRMSKDDGKSWPVQKLLQAGGSTYSDLAILPDKTIICLYGHGGIEHMPENVSLARFNLEWIQNSKLYF